MPRQTSSSGRTGRPAVTSRPQILAAARRIIDRDGWEKPTVRRLAAELGIGPTTLYHHVRDREDLLIQLLDGHSDQTLHPALPSEPRDRIVTAAAAIRSVWCYTVGEILVRAHSSGRPQNGGSTGGGTFFGGIDAARMPRLADIGDRWPELAVRDIYRQALEAFVDGLLAQATSGRKSRKTRGS
ncbi:TetR/AcrR family transcriptional regulator [Actinopolymorpha cephalotaxi]|uniref:AcrR family transcriptional regulator n=1 Tax=Actinopolymorpha cephalotaxi TaxID=504797 RepID=A0ABX2S935_9ACTN|nr:TetR/AcrR family transcriptional regulator [Actinopolymorpha cephalotaxi]NYH86152.1 AcrR family transcriptional regulator [Actinopolymorpha cephalotaxi]